MMKPRKTTSLKLILLFFCLPLFAACGGETEAAPTLAPPATEAAVEVQTVVVVATPTPSDVADEAAPPVDSSSDETAVSEDAPVLEAAVVEVGVPTMTTLTALNVRTGPGTQYNIVGSLPAGATAEVIGKSPNGHWWKIACPTSSSTQCWASAGTRYSSAENVENVAIASVPPAPTHVATATQLAEAYTPTYTPTASATSHGDATATATATTNTNATPTYTAAATATQDGAQTATYTPTPPNDATATYTPTATATDTAQEAPFDNDSLQNPALSVFLSPTGTREFTYANDVSYENGDQEDWVEFEFPNNNNTNQSVWLTLDCTIVGDPDAQLRATIYEDGVGTTQIAICNQGQVQLTVDNTKMQQVRIHFGITKPDIYATYSLTVVGFR